MDYSAVVGGCVSCSSLQGGRLAGLTPWGGMPHAYVLLVGDTVRATMSFRTGTCPPEVPRVALVDTFKDEAEESINVARALRERLRGVLLDTPAERGGVTLDLVYEVRARLDQAGFNHVDIYISGGLTPERIAEFVETDTPVNVFVVGQHISGASPIEITWRHQGDRRQSGRKTRPRAGRDRQPAAREGALAGPCQLQPQRAVRRWTEPRPLCRSMTRHPGDSGCRLHERNPVTPRAGHARIDEEVL